MTLAALVAGFAVFACTRARRRWRGEALLDSSVGGTPGGGEVGGEIAVELKENSEVWMEPERVAGLGNGGEAPAAVAGERAAEERASEERAEAERMAAERAAEERAPEERAAAERAAEEGAVTGEQVAGASAAAALVAGTAAYAERTPSPVPRAPSPPPAPTEDELEALKQWANGEPMAMEAPAGLFPLAKLIPQRCAGTASQVGRCAMHQPFLPSTLCATSLNIRHVRVMHTRACDGGGCRYAGCRIRIENLDGSQGKVLNGTIATICEGSGVLGTQASFA